MRSAVALTFGRVAGYALVGALLASVGGQLLGQVPVRWAEATVAATIGAYLAWAGLRLVRRPPPSLVTLGKPRQATSPIRVPPWLVGTATAALPCGALWGAYLVAGVSGNAADGASTMLGFAVASSPALIAATGLSGWLRGAQRPRATKLLSSVMLTGALVMVWRAYGALQQTEASCCAG